MAAQTLAALKATNKDFNNVLDSMFDKSSPVQARGYAATTPSLVQKFPAHTAVADGTALTVTIAQILTGVLVMDPTADKGWTLPTAALAVAGVDGVAVGDCINFSIINTGSVIGRHCLINTTNSIDHDNYFKDFAGTGPGVVTGGKVTIGKMSYLGIGSIIKNTVKVGDNTFIGGASFVNKNCEHDSLYFGVPAIKVKKNNLKR